MASFKHKSGIIHASSRSSTAVAYDAREAMGGGMSCTARRRFVGALAALVASPARALAARAARIGIVDNTIPLADLAGPRPRDPNARILVEQLRELGWVEGRTVEIIWRALEEDYRRRPQVLAELVRAGVDVLVVYGNEATLDAIRATRSIPIVMMSGQNALRAELVKSLARPGGNVTGFEMVADIGVVGKRLDLLKQAAPQVSRVSFFTADYALRRDFAPETLEAASRLGITLSRIIFDGPASFERMFAEAVREGVNGLHLGGYSPLLAARNQPTLRALVERHRLPAIHGGLEWTEAGAILNYGVDSGAVHRRAAFLIDRILRGTPAGQLPIERPTSLLLIANKRAARAIGLTLPASLLAQADRVIE